MSRGSPPHAPGSADALLALDRVGDTSTTTAATATRAASEAARPPAATAATASPSLGLLDGARVLPPNSVPRSPSLSLSLPAGAQLGGFSRGGSGGDGHEPPVILCEGYLQHVGRLNINGWKSRYCMLLSHSPMPAKMQRTPKNSTMSKQKPLHAPVALPASSAASAAYTSGSQAPSGGKQREHDEDDAFDDDSSNNEDDELGEAEGEAEGMDDEEEVDMTAMLRAPPSTAGPASDTAQSGSAKGDLHHLQGAAPVFLYIRSRLKIDSRETSQQLLDKLASVPRRQVKVFALHQNCSVDASVATDSQPGLFSLRFGAAKRGKKQWTFNARTLVARDIWVGALREAIAVSPAKRSGPRIRLPHLSISGPVAQGAIEKYGEGAGVGESSLSYPGGATASASAPPGMMSLAAVPAAGASMGALSSMHTAGSLDSGLSMPSPASFHASHATTSSSSVSIFSSLGGGSVGGVAPAAGLSAVSSGSDYPFVVHGGGSGKSRVAKLSEGIKSSWKGPKLSLRRDESGSASFHFRRGSNTSEANAAVLGAGHHHHHADSGSMMRTSSGFVSKSVPITLLSRQATLPAEHHFHGHSSDEDAGGIEAGSSATQGMFLPGMSDFATSDAWEEAGLRSGKQRKRPVFLRRGVSGASAVSSGNSSPVVTRSKGLRSFVNRGSGSGSGSGGASGSGSGTASGPAPLAIGLGPSGQPSSPPRGLLRRSGSVAGAPSSTSPSSRNNQSLVQRMDVEHLDVRVLKDGGSLGLRMVHRASDMGPAGRGALFVQSTSTAVGTEGPRGPDGEPLYADALRVGDRIVSVNGVHVQTIQALKTVLSLVEDGQCVTVRATRLVSPHEAPPLSPYNGSNGSSSFFGEREASGGNTLLSAAQAAEGGVLHDSSQDLNAPVAAGEGNVGAVPVRSALNVRRIPTEKIPEVPGNELGLTTNGMRLLLLETLEDSLKRANGSGVSYEELAADVADAGRFPASELQGLQWKSWLRAFFDDFVLRHANMYRVAGVDAATMSPVICKNSM